jgi:aquaporin Z
MMKYLVEFLGTFLFLSVILTQGQAIPIAVALAAVIFFGGSVSGGHFNPAVSLMMHVNNMIPLQDLVIYVVSQLAGGIVALTFFKNVVQKVGTK